MVEKKSYEFYSSIYNQTHLTKKPPPKNYLYKPRHHETQCREKLVPYSSVELCVVTLFQNYIISANSEATAPLLPKALSLQATTRSLRPPSIREPR